MVVWRTPAGHDRRACFARGNFAKCGKYAKSASFRSFWKPDQDATVTATSENGDCTRGGFAPTRLPEVRRSHTMCERPTSRMLSLAGWLLVGLFAASGCQTTSPGSQSLARRPIPDVTAISSLTPAPLPWAERSRGESMSRTGDDGATEIVWKRAPIVFSAATAPETWANS